MNAIGAALVAAAGVLAGLGGVGALHRQEARAGALCRLLALMIFELQRFRTPLPELFSSLSERTEGAAAALCARAAQAMEVPDLRFSEAWVFACGELTAKERELLLPLGGVLGRYGAEEQLAALEAALHEMRGCHEALRGAMPEKCRLYIGLSAACGLLAAILLY